MPDDVSILNPFNLFCFGWVSGYTHEVPVDKVCWRMLTS
jgi:hypothetical protein